jgi:erythromycin esterase-like protein
VAKMLRELLDRKIEYTRQDGASFLDAAQNARLVKSAERYYRVMYHGAAESWNLRDTHMFDTLEQLLAAKGASAKAVVWAHNSHIGNAAYTDMGAARDEINIGQLVRESYGEQTALIGFGTHTGTVAAATNWEGPMEVKQVRPSRADSYERVCHDSGIGRFLLDLRQGRNDATRAELLNPRRERFIGVIYPARDRTPEPLFLCIAANAVRRLCLVRQDQRADAAADAAEERCGRNVPVRALEHNPIKQSRMGFP